MLLKPALLRCSHYANLFTNMLLGAEGSVCVVTFWLRCHWLWSYLQTNLLSSLSCSSCLFLLQLFVLKLFLLSYETFEVAHWGLVLTTIWCLIELHRNCIFLFASFFLHSTHLAVIGPYTFLPEETNCSGRCRSLNPLTLHFLYFELLILLLTFQLCGVRSGYGW